MVIHRANLATVAFAVLGLSAAQSRGVIVQTGDGRNLAPPPEPYLDTWNYEGQFGLFTATPIDSTHILTAAHTTNVPRPFDFQGHEYTFQTTPITVPGTDLRIWTLDRTSDPSTFPTWAPLWDANVDGSEIGKTFIVVGRGVPRGNAIYAPINPGPTLSPVSASLMSASTTLATSASSVRSSRITGPSPAVPQDLRGWTSPFNYDGQQSWGLNKVDEIANFDATTPPSQRVGDLLSFDFDRADSPDAVEGEGGIVSYDSGGGIFIRSGGIWKLAGVNYAADVGYATSPEGLYDSSWPDGYARNTLMDLRGLYTLVDDGPDEGTAYDVAKIGYGDTPILPFNLASRVSTSRSYILAAIGASPAAGNASDVVVPEPASLIVIGAALARVRRRRVT